LILQNSDQCYSMTFKRDSIKGSIDVNIVVSRWMQFDYIINCKGELLEGEFIA
jgi:hypothetical protein